MELIKKEKFKPKKIKVDEVENGMTVKYGDMFTALFSDETSYFELIDINDLYEMSVIESTLWKSLEHIRTHQKKD
jgi:hypothetical protein